MNSPFNEQKYKGLLEGLEINEVMFSKLRELILGSEFYGNKKIKALNKIKSTHKLIDYFDFCSDIVREQKNVISYDLTHTLGNFLHDIEVSETIEGTRKLAQNGDFIISRLRSYLKEFAVVQSTNAKQVFSTEYLVYRPKTDKISANTLLVFCLTDEVQTILNHSQYGTEHPRFYEFVFNELPLPDVLFDLDKKINELFKIAHSKRKYSQTLYRQAEELFLETIGLQDFKPSKENISIKTLKESFLETGRLDAEYYQPKYENYIDLVKNYKNGFELLQNICNLKDNNFTPEDTKEYKYIELADIGNQGNIRSYITTQGNELPSRARRKVNTNDVMISSIEGSLQSCALVTENYDNALCSTGFYVINSKKINSETLLVLFKSEIIQNILKQGCSGTILTSINKPEFQNIPIPIIDLSTQQQISTLIKESYNLYRESEKLLQEAKEMLEKEIEK